MKFTQIYIPLSSSERTEKIYRSLTSKLGNFFCVSYISISRITIGDEMAMQLRLGAHWLAFLWELSARGPLERAARNARTAQATVFELVYHCLNHLPPSETAAALKSGGIWEATMCVFFPDGQGGANPPMGDPLSDDEQQRELAVKTFRRVLGFMVALRKYGIKIDLLVGPSCWVLGKNYGLEWEELRERIVRFYGALEMDLREAKVRVAIELLRAVEDHVVETVEHAVELIDLLNDEIFEVEFGAHLDTFHLQERGYDPAAAIRVLGKRIMYLHANGTGRRPAGGAGDTILWPQIIAALSISCVKGLGLVATNEPFCALVRENNAALGEGLPPPVEEPGGLETTRRTLEAGGVQFVN